MKAFTRRASRSTCSSTAFPARRAIAAVGRSTRPAPSTQSCACGALSARPGRQLQLQCRASIVSRTTLPEEFQESKGYKLQFVVFSRLAPEQQTTDKLREHLPEHEAWLKSLGDTLVFHGPFLNAEASYYGSEMFAILSDSAAEARQIVEQDPLHSKGIRRFELMSWVQQTQW